jgi:hypothetical protein
MKLNWTLFPHKGVNTLCVGEENRLMDSEVAEANKLIADIWQDTARLEEILNRGRARFANGVPELTNVR